MANHVYFSLNVEGVSEEEWEHLFKTEEVTYPDYMDETITRTRLDLVELHDQPFYDGVGEKIVGENGWLENGYDWYCTNVGAKWCNIDDWEHPVLNGYSAWSQPTYLAENIVLYLSQTYDREFEAKMTFEDEFRNFIGVEYFDSYKVDEEWAVGVSEEIVDGSQITDAIEEHFNCDVSDEDFDWWDDREDKEGNLTNPQEWSDDLVYSFFDTGEWRG